MVYVFGGDDGDGNLDSVEQYDRAANKWTVLQARMFVPRVHLSAACANGRIFVFGGYSKNGCESSVECYDPSKKRFSNVSPLPKLRSQSAVASVCIATRRPCSGDDAKKKRKKKKKGGRVSSSELKSDIATS